MDVVKEKKTAKQLLPKRLMIGGGVCVAVFLLWQLNNSSGAESVSRSGILTGKVKYGDLQVQVDGYGSLRSDKQKLLTTTTSGTVEEIFLKPGANVTPESVILRLSNPELEKELLSEQEKLTQEKVGLSQLKLSHRLAILDEDAKLGEIRSNYLAAKLTREEQEEWAKKGVVSKLSFRETQLKETLLRQSIASTENRIGQLKLVHQEIIKIQEKKVSAQENRFNIVKEQHGKLKVLAGMAGVVQSLSVELGQSFGAGQKLALIGGTKDLVAMVKIPQAAVQQVKVGQPVTIDTRQEKAKGQVRRIDPAVDNGTVLVEVAFVDGPPASARPELNVDAVIQTNTLKNVTYVERPANARANASAPVFVLNSSGNKAQRVDVKFGAEAGRYIEVVSGLKVEDTLIVSDMSKYSKLNNIALDQ